MAHRGQLRARFADIGRSCAGFFFGFEERTACLALLDANALRVLFLESRELRFAVLECGVCLRYMAT